MRGSKNDIKSETTEFEAGENATNAGWCIPAYNLEGRIPLHEGKEDPNNVKILMGQKR